MTMKQTAENTAMIDRDYFDLYSMCDDIIRDANELYDSIVRLFEFTEEKSLRPCFSKPELKKINRVLSKVCRRTDDYARDMCVCVSSDNASCCCDDSDSCCCDDGDCTNDPTLSPDDLLRDSCDCCPDLDERVNDKESNDNDDVEVQILDGNIVECKTSRVKYDNDSDASTNNDNICITKDEFDDIGICNMTYEEFSALSPEKKMEVISDHMGNIIGELYKSCSGLVDKSAKQNNSVKPHSRRKISRVKIKSRHK